MKPVEFEKKGFKRQRSREVDEKVVQGSITHHYFQHSHVSSPGKQTECWVHTRLFCSQSPGFQFRWTQKRRRKSSPLHQPKTVSVFEKTPKTQLKNVLDLSDSEVFVVCFTPVLNSRTWVSVPVLTKVVSYFETRERRSGVKTSLGRRSKTCRFNK